MNRTVDITPGRTMTATLEKFRDQVLEAVLEFEKCGMEADTLLLDRAHFTRLLSLHNECFMQLNVSTSNGRLTHHFAGLRMIQSEIDGYVVSYCGWGRKSA